MNELKKLAKAFKKYDNILIGAGAGLSTAAGHEYDGKRFLDNFKDFHDKYGIEDMYSGGFYPFNTLEEKFAWWSRHIDLNRYKDDQNSTYTDLYELVKDKNYFVLTTNVDHLFLKSGFSEDRIFYTQGDYGVFQCSVPCHNKLYDNYEIVQEMVKKQKDMKVPTELVPTCPKCGAPMTTNLRADNTFVQDDNWYEMAERYQKYVDLYADKKIMLLELGVGMNTPGIIKYPFWRFAIENRKALFVSINKGEIIVPKELLHSSILIDGDIHKVLQDVMKMVK